MRRSGKFSSKLNRANAVAWLLTFGIGLLVLTVGNVVAQNLPQAPPRTRLGMGPQ